jgi:hypothetical protein
MEPDLHLINQVEQVTTLFFWKDRPGALVFLIQQLLVWLIFRCKKQRKQPGAAEGDLLAKGQSGNTTGPTRRFHEPGHIGCRAVALPNSVRQLHNSVFQRENSQQFAVLSSEATPSPKDFCGNPGLTG